VLFGKNLRVVKTVSRFGRKFVHCELPDGSIGAFPEWMMNSEVCAHFSEGVPQLSLEALHCLQSFLKEVSSSIRSTTQPLKKTKDYNETAISKNT
jgi:hypothetical protein